MKSTLILLSLASSAAGLASIPPPTGQHFANPSATGGMADLSIKKDPMAPLGKQWTTNMDRKVASSHGSDGESFVHPYGEENQANGKGGKGPLAKEWTSSMDMKVQKGVSASQGSAPSSPIHFQAYGLDHQANGHGGRSPLGKEWTTSMDSKPRKSGF